MDNKNNVSQTAMLIASLRALACYEEDPQVRGDDCLAELFLPEDKRVLINSADVRTLIRKAIPEGLYEYVIARTKYFDGLFLNALQQQIPQIVLLGAGYDSRAYRYSAMIQSTKIFEVDTTGTQQLKREILKDNSIEIHPNVRYAEVDFEQDGWFNSLYDAGYQNTLKTLYIWEGVTFYLSPGSVGSTLNAVRQNSLTGSIISFDYQHTDRENMLIDTGLEDENIKFGLNIHACENYLNELGYSVIEQVDSSAMSDRYLMMTDGKKFGEIKSIMNFVAAEVR